jgi:predicted ATPase
VASEIVELRLDSFKSVRGARIELGALTLLIGRNGSGKSNVLDALAVLSAIASGSDLRDALDGGRDGPIVRGGSAGCAPLGASSFAIGCTAMIDGEQVRLDIEVQVSPTVQIVSERLYGLRVAGARKGEPLDYLRSEPPQPYSGDITARWFNGKRGLNPPVVMRATQLLTSQVASRVPATSAAGRRVHEVAEGLLAALGGIFILDPVPHQMREFVPAKDDQLRRTADNLSASLSRLSNDPSVAELLLTMTTSLSEAQVSALATATSELGDVMVTVSERIGGEVRTVPARLMSDGTLRYLAIAAAMLDTPAESSSGIRAQGGRLLVLEELENGLHPSQASLLLRRLKESARERQVRTIATTHSPAMLDALDGVDHDSVVVASRDENGWSAITALTDFPDYFEVVGRASLGASAVQDRLRPSEAEPRVDLNALRVIFGAH